MTTMSAPVHKHSEAVLIVPEKQITLYLKNGGVVTGELVSDTPASMTLRWEYGNVDFQRAEIQRVVRGKQDTDENDVAMPWEGEGEAWPYHHDVVVKLMKGTVVDGEITSVTPTTVILTQALPSGGQIEHTIQRADIDQLFFKPIHNARSDQIGQNLRSLFPNMQWHEEGLFTVVSDSTTPSVKDDLKTIRELATDWYLTFYPLVRTRQPSIQQYLVIFDDWESYLKYAATDGVPGWIAVGYFHPQDEVLYCFNVVGERFSELLYEAYLGQFRKARDQVSAQVKGTQYQSAVEGRLSEFLQKLEAAHARVREAFREMGAQVIRHELTHAMFHNWHLQGIVLSQLPAQGRDEAIQKKAAFLHSGDPEEKRRLLDELLKRKSGTELPQMQASNSWVVEGLAGYMEPSPLGGVHPERLSELQEAMSHKQIMPLEFLNAFRMGSFPGMATQSALYAYAQSWGMCHFLMHRYQDGFLSYLDRLAREQPKEGEDTLSWLFASLGKGQQPLEEEFLAYQEQFPPEDPMWLKQMQGFLDLRAELIALANQL